MPMRNSHHSANTAINGNYGKSIMLPWFALWCLFGLCLPQDLTARGELGAPFIRNYLPEEYKADNQNWVAVQDDRGVMFFGNGDGILVSYGQRWELVRISNGSTARSLTIDKAGRVYVGAVGELGHLAVNSLGKWKYVSLMHLIPEKDRVFNDVWEAYAAEDGVYFMTVKKVFYYHDGIIDVLPIVSNPQSLFSVYGQIFNARTEGGLFFLDSGKSRPLPHCGRFTLARSGTVYLLPYKGGKLLICTQKEGFFLYDLPRCKNNANVPEDAAEVLEPFPTDIDRGITGSPYFRAEVLGEDQYVFTIWGKGLAIIDHRGKLVRRIQRRHGLLGNNASNVFVDKDRNTWAMVNKGLCYVETGSPLSLFNYSMGLDSMALASCKHRGNMYVGTLNGPYCLLPRPGEEGGGKRFMPVEGAGEQCFALFSAGNVLLAGGEGVYVVKGLSAKQLFFSNTVLSFAVIEKFPDHIFYGMGGGFSALKVERGNAAGKDEIFTPVQPGLFRQLDDDSIYEIFTGKNGDLWLDTRDRGVVHLRFTGNRLDQYELRRYYAAEGLPKGGDIGFGYLNGHFYVWHASGIYKALYDGTGPGSTLTRFEKECSLEEITLEPSVDFIYDQLRQKEKLFVFTKRQLGIVTRSPGGPYKWNILPFKKTKGVEHYFMEENGVAWLCSSEGAYRFDPGIKKAYDRPYPALICKVQLGNGRTLFNGTYYDPASAAGEHYNTAVLRQPPAAVPQLEFQDNSITFFYSALFFEKESANRYSTLLEGFKDKWSPWTGETQAVFTNLGNGAYRFRVKAKNVFLNESSEAFYEFEILPPLQRTVYAYILYVLLFILLFWGGVRLNSRRLVAAKHRLEEKIKERTAEISRVNRQIAAQKEELQAQKDEIHDQADDLRTANRELEKANEIARRERLAAEMANRSKSEFLARMSHEIRTPLNAVIGFADMMQDTQLNEAQADYANTIARSGEILIDLLNDILDFSKIEAGELTFDPIDFDPEITVFDISQMMVPRVGDRNIELLCRVGKNVPAFIKTDPGRFRQVVVNLMSNAAKFTQKGEIELSLEVEEEEKEKLKLHVKVRDTGIGIEQDKLEAIFDVFQQADGSTTRKYGGTGLGLSICRQIARLMEGDVWAQSERGKGSTFHFTSWVQKSNMKPEKVAVSLVGKKAIVVDDNVTNLELLSHVLSLYKMEVVQVRDPREVIPIILEHHKKNTPFDIAVIDIQMPEMDGFELAGEIRKLSPPVVARMPLLAFASSGLNRSWKFKESGYNGYLPKPIQRKKMLEMMERLLGMESGVEEELKEGVVTRHTILEARKHGLHILLAEDNPVNIKLARYILEKAGYRFSAVSNGLEVVEEFTSNPGKYDLILMDIQMPELDGREATRRIRAKGFTDIPIIALTAEAMKGDMEKCLEAGMNDYVPKPIKREMVFRIVEKWCL